MPDMLFPKAAVNAVGKHDQGGTGEASLVVHLCLEAQAKPGLASPLLQDQEQLPPRAATEAVSADPMHRTAEVDGDIIPIREFLRDATITRRVVFFEIVQRGVGENN